MTDSPALPALHAVRTAWLDDVLAQGLQRPDSAAFSLREDGRVPASRVLRRTLTMALFFGVSMSTLRMWAQEPPASYTDWYRSRPDRLPVLVRLALPPSWFGSAQEERRYLCRLDSEYGSTTRYAKVATGGPVAAGAPGQETLAVTLADVERAESAVRRALAAGGTAPDLGRSTLPEDEPFYRKFTGDMPALSAMAGGSGVVRVVPDGHRHPDAVLALPVLCAALAEQLLPAVADWSAAG
ncbi:hypothetical protein ACFY0N_29245 [Streptomyces vinaceus]|uniref:hypothetical protein n=1 Tax=Streptomyces vinaceus TaxID=1960 RepID=UPI0035D8775A